MDRRWLHLYLVDIIVVEDTHNLGFLSMCLYTEDCVLKLQEIALYEFN